MQKIRRIIYARYLNKPVNIALLLSCLAIVLVQVYFMSENWFKEHMKGLVSLINDSPIILAVITGTIPLMPWLFQKIDEMIKTKKNRGKAGFEQKIEETKVFPGAVTHQMIEEKKVVLVSEASKKDRKEMKPMILDREQQCGQILERIKSIEERGQSNQLNCLYLTGASGAGKSILLRTFLKSKLEEQKKKCLYFNDYTLGCDIIYKEIKKSEANVVIFDQFETSILYSDIYKYIKQLIDKSDKKVVYIFSFPQDVFEQIVLNISTKILKKEARLKKEGRLEGEAHFMEPSVSNIYFLSTDKHDIRQLKKLIFIFLRVREEDVDECLKECIETYKRNGKISSVLQLEKFSRSLIFLCSILAKIKLGKSPLVEFSVISYIYALYREAIDYNIEEYIDDIDRVFKLYMDNWALKFSNAETGKMILQLISDGKKYSEEDIKCVTFEEINDDSQKEKDRSFHIVSILKQNKFIQFEKTYSGFMFGVSAVHDYIAMKIGEYCFENLKNDLRQNVDHYRKRVIQTALEDSIQADSKGKMTILKRYRKFHNKKSQVVINILVYLLMVASIGISSYKGGVCTSENEHIYYIFIAVGCLLTSFYMYNVVMWFFLMLKKRYYYPLSFGGSVLIVLCYFFPDFWGVFSGIEIVILGFSLFAINRITINMAVSFFKGKGALYVVLGIMVIGFGFVYAYVKDVKIRSALAVAFIVYILASDYTHMRYSYIIDKVGKGNTI